MSTQQAPPAPRLASPPATTTQPSSESVTLVEQQQGDLPPARFGHTATYMGNCSVIVFGGAIGDLGRYTITNDTYSLNLNTLEWTKLIVEEAPSARAAHAATCVDLMQLVIYGGATGGGSLSTDELYLLDIRRRPTLRWLTVPITGVTPGRRYGHTMVYDKVVEGLNKANLIIFGGNDGNRTLNDIWYMDVLTSPFMWHKVYVTNEMKQPSPRVYHSAGICKHGSAFGMMVVFGGRTSDNRSLRDGWGLRQHRDRRWDWVDAPIKRGPLPEPRFQHACVFFGSKMLIIGGRDSEVSKTLPTAVYDTEACEWKTLPSLGRFRHASWGFNNFVYTFGGFDHCSQSRPTSDLQILNIQVDGQPPIARINSVDSQSSINVSSPPLVKQSRALTSASASPTKREVRLSTRVYTKVDSPHNPDFSVLVQKISIDRLEDEGRKIRGYVGSNGLQPLARAGTDTVFADQILRRLLRPNITPVRMDKDYNPNAVFCLPWEDVSKLTVATLAILKQDPMMLQLRAPIKVYGDIHGQFYDLMRLFGSYKAPVEEDWTDENEVNEGRDIEGDIDSIDYLFLGDFVDRGTHSLEVICLLFALKLRYPHQIHLIRGNHEDKAINGAYGFQDECRRRLRENPLHPESCWEKFNKVFEYLPVGALIDSRIVCIHGGIGGSISTLDDISSLQRPLVVSQMPQSETEQRVTDLLWSDPTDNDSITGVVPNTTRDQDGTGRIFKYGPDRVQKFLSANKLDMIVRAHECVMDGFERFAGGKLITLFSATDYCGHRNAGALLFIRRDLTIIPKIIYPPDRDCLSLRNTWLSMESRPPTPPRSIRRDRDQDLGF